MENLIDKYSRLETPNLILRKARLTDLDSIYNNVWSSTSLNKYMFWETTLTKEDALKRLLRTIQFQSNHFEYFICDKKTDEAIGFAGMELFQDNVYSEIGICLAEKYQHCGYGKEVLGALEKLAFDELKGERFLYGFLEGNVPSMKLCISMGFKYLDTQKRIRERDHRIFNKICYYLDKETYEKENII